MYGRLGQGSFRARRKATGGPVEVYVVTETYLRECGAFAEDVGLRSEAPAANKAVMLLEVGVTLCDGSVFLMPSEIPEMSNLPSAGGDLLLGELPRGCSVECGDSPPLWGGFPLCAGVLQMFRVGVEGGMMESPCEAAQQGSGSHC